MFQIPGLHDYDEGAMREALDALESAPPRPEHLSPPKRGGVSLHAPDFFQPKDFPAPKHKKYQRIIFKKQVLIEPWKNSWTKKCGVFTKASGRTPRHLLPSSRSARGEA